MSKLTLITQIGNGSVDNGVTLEKNLKIQYPDNWRDVGHGNYALIADEVTKDIAVKLGITKDSGTNSPGSYMVSKVNGYYGFGPNEVWEWIDLKVSQSG